MDDNQLEPLYKHFEQPYDCYVCMGTGLKCEIVMRHFAELNKDFLYSAVSQESKLKASKKNICADEHCPIYNNIIKIIAKFAKDRALQK